MAEQFLKMGLEKLENVTVVAYKNHMRRARANTRYEAERIRGHDFEKVLMADTKNVQPDPESLQHWTRGTPLDMRHEISSRIHHSLSLLGPGIPAKYFLD